MTTKNKELGVEPDGLEADVASILDSFVDIAGWKALLELLMRLAVKKQNGRMAGIIRVALHTFNEES
jgi:hypothetical protein